nr:hypothetical protein BaRGS_030753 [Batillaria attramentaria]
MPAIREESPLRTNRIPVHIIPPGAAAKREGLFQKSMIIQTLPDEPKKPPPKVTPGTRYHDNVEQVVADYLHFSRYGKVLPVTQGFAPLACPCCVDRNRENIQRIKERNRPPPQEPDLTLEPGPETGSNDPEPGPSHAADGAPSPRRRDEPSPRRDPNGRGYDYGRSGGNFPSSWMEYQPLPYAHTYLNPEFNRAVLLQGYEEDRKQHDDASAAYVSGRVLDANTKYDLAMDRLERSLKTNFS